MNGPFYCQLATTAFLVLLLEGTNSETLPCSLFISCLVTIVELDLNVGVC